MCHIMFTKKYSEVSTVFNSGMDTVWAGEVSAEDAAKDIQAQVDMIYSNKADEAGERTYLPYLKRVKTDVKINKKTNLVEKKRRVISVLRFYFLHPISLDF